MAEETQKKTDNRTATQRLEALEQVCGALYNTIQELIRANDKIAPLVGDIPVLREATKLLNKRIEAVVSVADPMSGINADTVSAKMVEMNVADLKGQITGWLENGALTPNETGVDAGTFIVAEETKADGTVFNPRVQFPMNSQNAEIQAALMGKKAGDKVNLGEDKLGLTLLEIYHVTPLQAENTGSAPETNAEAPAEAAPATEASA